MKVLLLCVETSKTAKTDSSYIDETIRHYYNINNSIRLQYSFLESKTKYNGKKLKVS